MRKSIMKIGMVIVSGLILAGCGGGPHIKIAKLPQNEQATIGIDFGLLSSDALQAELRNKTNILGLQLAAEVTLRNGYRYFTIKYPSGAISNVKGSLVNNAEDFIKTCNTNSTGKEFGASMMTLGIFSITIRDKCNIVLRNSHSRGHIVIIASKEQPIEYASYDAKGVIKYLKEKNLYTNIPAEEIKESIINR